MTIARFMLAAVAAGCLVMGWGLPARAADDYGRLTIVEENDGLLPDHWDRHYTQGAMLSYLSPTQTDADFTAGLFDALSGHLPILQPGPDIKRKFNVVVGQSIFTPVDYHNPIPDPADRPFAGWLYGGGSLLQETGGRMLESIELLAGVVGPASLAEDAQEGFHAAAGFNNKNLDQAWRTQLRNEPGVMLSYDRSFKAWRGTLGGIEADLIPNAGVTVGNVMTYAEGGVQVRVGQNLGADYGVARVRPGVSGTPWFDAGGMTSPFGWYLFAGAEVRVVAQNIFLDGNTIAASRSVDKNVLVADLSGGASLFWSDWVKLDFSVTERTKEFTTQTQADHFATAALSFRF